MIRKLKLYTRLWVSVGTLREGRFTALLSKQGSAELFDSKFIEMVQKRRDGLWTAAFKLYTLQLPIFAFLVFTLIPIDAHVSVLGISPTASRNLREVMVVVAAVFALIAAGITVSQTTLNEIIKAYIRKTSKGDQEVNEYLDIGHGIAFWMLPPTKLGTLQLRWGYHLFLSSIAIVFFAVLTALAVGAVYIHFLILKDIYLNPSYSRAVSIGVIAFVLGCDFVCVGFSVLSSGMIGARNFSNLLALSKLKETAPAKADEVYKEAARQYYRKPRWRRMITRPKLPKNIPPAT